MDGLLTPVSQIHTSNRDTQPLLQEITSNSQPIGKKSSGTGSNLATYEDVLEALKAEPDYDTLSCALNTLLHGQHTKTQGAPCNIHQPNPLNSQIIQTLVTQTVPNYWDVLIEEAADDSQNAAQPPQSTSSSPLLQHLLDCLRNLTGINVILTHLRGLLGGLGNNADETRRSMMGLNINTLLDLLCSLLKGHSTLSKIWSNSSQGLKNNSMLRPLTQEFVNVTGGGKIISLAAEAEMFVQKDLGKPNAWAASSKDYTLWLVENLTSWAKEDSLGSCNNLVSQLLIKALQLGHTDLLVECLVQDLLLSTVEKDARIFEQIFQSLPQYDQKRLLIAILKYATDSFSRLANTTDEASLVPAVAGLLRTIISHDEKRRGIVVTWLTSVSGGAPGEPVGIRRAALAALAEHREDITVILEKSLALFGDNLYIKHAPLLQQEAHVQILLLSAGYVHRSSPIKLAILVKSGVYLNAVSSRLSAPQTRARILGMIVGEALSTLAQGNGKGLSFDMAILKTDEAKWYKSLVDVADKVGSLEPLRECIKPELPEPKARTQAQRPAQPPKHVKKTTTKPAGRSSGFVIEEVNESKDEDDLVPYAKPDSDPEDSEDDAELVRRDKPKAPVYIRDLITYLRDTENYDKQELSLSTAPVLIRRKANYGTEVKDHVEELARLLVGTQDKFNMENFESLRTQGMISIVVAQPQKMGPWFAKTFFDGDYSLSQRASVLSVLGLAAREIAGFEQSGYVESASFPSKRLPGKVEQFYMTPAGQNQTVGGSKLKPLPHSAIDSITQSITAGFLAPMVANAADQQVGPDLLKLSSFSSRLQQRQGSDQLPMQKSQKKTGVRAIPNTTAQLISTSFFFPLTARFQAALSSSTARARAIVLQPELLTHLLRTLGILVHAAGPSTLSLPDMTAEIWGLLLGSGVRARCAGDLSVTRAALFALLALLEVNGTEELRMRDICRELAREVVETQEWVAQVFESTRGGDGEGGEENEVKMLAAGVLIRLRDAMDKFRAFLIGDMIG